jgi:hypothetical protein
MKIIYVTVSTAGINWEDDYLSWIGKAREIVFVNSKGFLLEVNTGKIEYLLICHCQNSEQNHDEGYLVKPLCM